MFLRFDYSTPVVISEVELKMGLWVEDVARGLLITVRDREGRECLLFDGIKHTPWDPERERFRITFPPREVTSLRLEQTGSHPVFDWSVAEVLIRGPQSSH
jgi:hypothetical protein